MAQNEAVAEFASETTNETIVSYKGFDKDWKCRDFPYEVGKTYAHDGAVEACSSGFHACEYPLDVFSYYPPAGSKFAVVEQSGTLSRHGDDSKVASSSITVKAELTLPGIIKAAIEYTISRAKPIKGEHSTGYRGAASSTGYQGAASSTGTRGAASSTGYQGAASSTGDYGAASSTGDYGAASSTGYQGAASSTGDYGAASSTGTRGAASSTGYQGAASSTGDYGAASSTGYYGAASSTGDYGAASSTGTRGAAMASGYQGRAKGADGNALFLVYRDNEYVIRKVGAAIVGENGIKADTWYSLNEAGDFVEVTE
ncbi:hypothetical protein ACDA63_07355 [Uliginosibacterium sp. sgz301328]|uniref:DUF7666 domain-containing protein n=1 Tax=Uliginosibacterium sp. sgz301328 TaxID=3243764 RepID=UPI00359D2DAD